MSEEEKKAIKDCNTIFMCLEDMMSEKSADNYRSSYRLIKNLINNQQKEIEKLNFKNHMLKKWNKQLDKNCISKDKIREKIKEYQEKFNNYPNYTPRDFQFRQEYLHKFRALEELLEEN